MRNFWLFIFAAVVSVSCWAADWPMSGGNPQRNGWAGGERQINKANVASLKLLYKHQTDNVSKGSNSLTAPIISGNLITYRGFKEMLMFGGSSDKLFSVDADLNRLIWEAHFPSAVNKPPEKSTVTCPGGLTAPLAMAGSSSVSLHFAALASRTTMGPGMRPRRPSPYLPPLAQSVYPLLPTTLTRLNVLYAVSSDGYLHVVNSSTGQDLIPPMHFVRPNAKVTSLNLRDNVVYATTANNCDGFQNGLFAIDLLSPGKTVTSFILPKGEFSGTAGTAIGNDGTIYVQVPYAPDSGTERFYDAVVALTPKELKLKDYFLLSGKPVKNAANETPGITPVVFSFPTRDLIIAGGRNGRLYLLDSRSLGGPDHRTPLFMSAAFAQSSKGHDGNGFRGIFSTWLDVDTGARRFYAPIFGPLRSSSSGLKTAATHGSGNGVIAAFQLGGTNEKPTLQPLWVSGDLISPAPPVIADRMIFVLSTGEFPRTVKKNGKLYSMPEFDHLAKPASLHVFDAITGSPLYSSGSIAATASLSGGLAVANGRAYFTAHDNAVYCFGIPAQQTQLIKQ